MYDYFARERSALRMPYAHEDKAPESFWRKGIPEQDAEGKVVLGGLWEHQREWWELPTFVKALVGGYGAGKTLAMCKRLIASAIHNAPCPVAGISPTFPMARETLISTTIQLLHGKKTLYGRRFWWKYNKTTHEFRIKFEGREARLLIYSGENPDALKGPNLAAAGIDEPFIQSVDVYKQILARIRHPDARLHELLLTGTPEELNWGYDLCMGKDKEVQDVGFVQASTRGNLALDEEYVSRLEAGYSAAEVEAYVDGSFRNLTQGMVYHAFDVAHNVKALERPPNAELGIGMDFNVDPFAFLAFWHTPNHIHFFDEQELHNADTEYACHYIKTLHYGKEVRTIYPDSAGNQRSTKAPGAVTDFHHIRAAGFEIDAPHANPRIKERVDTVNGALRSSKGHTKMTVSPKCTKLVKYLMQYSHRKKNKQKHMSHLLDAMGYPVHRLFPIVKPTIEIRRLHGA